MAYSSSINADLVLQDVLGGQGTFSAGLSTVVPTKPAFSGAGSATTSYAAVSYGSVTTPKALVIVNDGAQELTVSLDSGTTDNFTLGVASSTSKLNYCIIPTPAAAPRVKTASSTSAYRTFILE